MRVIVVSIVPDNILLSRLQVLNKKKSFAFFWPIYKNSALPCLGLAAIILFSIQIWLNGVIVE